jgi:acetate---CoA ligase (ADP-forming)
LGTVRQRNAIARKLAGRCYRNLIPRTDTAPLAGLVSRLSELAADFSDLVPECDLNPVLIRKGSGDVRVVDALFVAAGQ